MDGPRLFVQAHAGRELGLHVRDACARESILLPLHRDPGFRRNLRGWCMDSGTFLRSPSDMHSVVRHSCAPSAYVDWSCPSVRALRDLREGDEITLDLNTIYEFLPVAFTCSCGAPECLHDIMGYRSLTLAQKLSLELYLSPHLKRLLTTEMMTAWAHAS